MDYMHKKVTLSLEEKVYEKFQKFCEDRAIMLSKRIENEMKRIMEEDR
jgi:hypothetical protein